MFLWTWTHFGSYCHGSPPGFNSRLIIFLWTPDASAPVQGLWEQNLVLLVELQLPFYLEKVGLAGELVAELFNFIFGKVG